MISFGLAHGCQGQSIGWTDVTPDTCRFTMGRAAQLESHVARGEDNGHRLYYHGVAPAATN